jgi:hypothetical protein
MNLFAFKQSKMSVPGSYIMTAVNPIRLCAGSDARLWLLFHRSDPKQFSKIFLLKDTVSI